MTDTIILQDADTLLLLDADTIYLTFDAATVQHGGAKDEIHPETRRYWESERQRLKVLADDEEVLLVMS